MNNAEKEEKRIENLAVHDTTVATRDEFDRILPAECSGAAAKTEKRP